MPQFSVHCVPTTANQSSDPCTKVDGVNYAPVMVEYTLPEYDYLMAADFFAWALSLVLICYVIGLVTGQIIKVIRSV